jgi:anti-sigma factor RsiW
VTNCRQVTRLISESADRRLAITEQDMIERHFEICPACRRCARQIDLLRESMRRLRGERPGP